MTIIRNGQAITLTTQELELAYREKEYLYRLEDAKRHFAEFIYGEPADADTWDPEDPEYQEFIDQYGFSPNDAICPESENYLLDSIITSFADDFDCNLDENTQWSNAIQDVISSLGV